MPTPRPVDHREHFDRNQRIVELRAADKSLREIALEFGISTARVWQILQREAQRTGELSHISETKSLLKT